MSRVSARSPGEDTGTWAGYLAAHRKRRAFFKALGATATDHGHPSAATADLGAAEAQALFARVVCRRSVGRRRRIVSRADADRNGGDESRRRPGHADPSGLVPQPQSARSTQRFGRDKGADIPTPTDYVRALKPLLDRFGNERALTIILFTLDETAYSRELAPLAGHYPALAARAALVVFRFRRRHAPLPGPDDGDRRLRQHGRLQRRHARLSFDPGPPRRGAPRRLRGVSQNSLRRTSSTRTKRTNWRMTSPIAWRKRRIGCEGGNGSEALGTPREGGGRGGMRKGTFSFQGGWGWCRARIEKILRGWSNRKGPSTTGGGGWGGEVRDGRGGFSWETTCRQEPESRKSDQGRRKHGRRGRGATMSGRGGRAINFGRGEGGGGWGFRVGGEGGGERGGGGAERRVRSREQSGGRGVGVMASLQGLGRNAHGG